MRILCDVHTHTMYSRHAYSTMEENVREAASQGFELLGLTDHFSSMLYEEQTLKNFQFFLNLNVIPEVWHGVRVLHGCEVDIVDLEGNLFGHDIVVDTSINGDKLEHPRYLGNLVLSRCDYAVASIHGKDWARSATPAQVTRMYVNVLDNPHVLILGHLGRSFLDFDVDALVCECRDRGKLIEINEATYAEGHATEQQDRCRRIAERCAELGCMVSFGSDAHIATRIAHAGCVSRLLDEIHFPEELMACRDAATFLKVKEAAGVGIPH